MVTESDKTQTRSKLQFMLQLGNQGQAAEVKRSVFSLGAAPISET